MSYITMEGEGAIVCIEITSHSNEGAPRPFVVMLTTKNGTAGNIKYVLLCLVHIQFYDHM